MTHMTEERHQNTAGLVVFAALAGAAAALLFAPKKGTEMREEIKGRYSDAMTRTQTKVQNAQSKVAESVSSASDRVKTAADKAADKTKSVATQAADQTKTVADQATDQTKTVADQTDQAAQKTRGTRKSSGTFAEDEVVDTTVDTDLRPRL